jgi:hypothetical protein
MVQTYPSGHRALAHFFRVPAGSLLTGMTGSRQSHFWRSSHATPLGDVHLLCRPSAGYLAASCSNSVLCPACRRLASDDGPACIWLILQIRAESFRLHPTCSFRPNPNYVRRAGALPMPSRAVLALQPQVRTLARHLEPCQTLISTSSTLYPYMTILHTLNVDIDVFNFDFDILYDIEL